MLSVACVIPAYNAEALLPETLENALGQEPRPEVVVVDDGSTDATAAVAERFGVRVLRQTNQGPAAARNLGVSQTSADIIAFLDSDDLWKPGRIASALAAYAADPELGACVCHAQNFVGALTPVGDPVPAFTGSGVTVRRSAWERVGPFDAVHWHSADLDWFVRARGQGVKIHLQPETFMLRRLRDNSLSATKSADSLREHLSVLRQEIARRRPG